MARIAPPPREVTRRTIGKEELTRIPGTRGDALRTVELMPGVARPPLGAGLLIVRGSAPDDTQAMFEGLPVQLLYHFGGLTSFINSRMIDSIDFYPGNFSVRYGRRRGGIIEVGAAEIPRDEFHGVADVNLIDASLLVADADQRRRRGRGRGRAAATSTRCSAPRWQGERHLHRRRARLLRLPGDGDVPPGRATTSCA